MDYIKDKFFDKAKPIAEEVKTMVKNFGKKPAGEYTIEQILTGMKGVVSLLTLTSKLDPIEGIRFRGYSIPELQKHLPKLSADDEPLPEGIFYLLLLDELPTLKDVNFITEEWQRRSEVPQYVFDILDQHPNNSRPMVLFSSAILSMAHDSRFIKKYIAGMHKKEYWDTTFEDAIDLIARLPRIASYIYRKLYHNNEQIESDPKLDWAANLAHMMGYDNEEIYKLFRLYMVVHSDHEGGNVSAHTTHLVNSALSNPYYSLSAGMCGLAGPLHGMANQEVIKWVLQMREEIGPENCLDKEMVEKFVLKTLSNGQVIPGFGHAVLRKTDPRYMAQREFALKYLPEDEIFKIVSTLFEVVPPVLQKTGKVKNPYPNVDAHSGALLLHYGIKEYPFYTVLFGVSRALGVLSQLIWDRALGLAIERPKSQNLEWFRDQIKKN